MNAKPWNYSKLMQGKQDGPKMTKDQGQTISQE